MNTITVNPPPDPPVSDGVTFIKQLHNARNALRRQGFCAREVRMRDSVWRYLSQSDGMKQYFYGIFTASHKTIDVEEFETAFSVQLILTRGLSATNVYVTDHEPFADYAMILLKEGMEADEPVA